MLLVTQRQDWKTSSRLFPLWACGGWGSKKSIFPFENKDSYEIMVFFPFMFAIRGAMAPKEMRKLDIAPKMSLPKPCFFQCDISSTPWFSSLPQSAVRPRIVSSSVTFFMHHSMKVAPRDPNASCPWMRPRTLNCSTPPKIVPSTRHVSCHFTMLPPEHFCVNVTILIHINDCPSETVARRNILLAHFFSACFSFT